MLIFLKNKENEKEMWMTEGFSFGVLLSRELNVFFLDMGMVLRMDSKDSQLPRFSYMFYSDLFMSWNIKFMLSLGTPQMCQKGKHKIMNL